MFIEEEEWSDGQEDKVLINTVPKTKQANSSTNVKPKAVGKKSLMHTLQILGSVPDWKSSDREQDSDSETEEAPSHDKKKKKKKRRKRRKQATGDDQQENGDLDQTVEEETPSKKKRKDNKPGPLKVKTTSVGETKDGKKTQSVKVNINEPDNTDKLNRKQWKNKMKNKRKCKNKYKSKEEEVNKTESTEKHEPKAEVKTDTSSNKNENKNSFQKPDKEKGKVKPQKRKKVKEDTEASCATETLVEEKEKQTKAATKSPAGEHTANITDTLSPIKRLKPGQSREQILKREKLRKMLQISNSNPQLKPVQEKDEQAAAPEEEEEKEEEEVKLDRSSSLRSRMEQRLESARFRYINELLYSTTSGEARRMFKQDPQAFGIYHRGYTAQVQRWPANPVDAIISYIQHKPASLVVADFGCGDCKIARSVKNKVHSFDLAATCDLVTVCDMANVPLRDASVDIAVFCLSLMGTNLGDFLAEANRVLKMGGVLKIAEVASRFENTRNFITALANLGFKMMSKDTENTHFYSFELSKTANAPENVKKFGLQLRACVYKKR